jgi:hypothetical protein
MTGPAVEMSHTSSARTILLLAANPGSTPVLDLKGERRAISQCLERAPKQHTLRVVAESAVTDDDLRRALLKHEPEIVHFSGHGVGRGGLVFEEAGDPLFISGEALAGLLGLCSRHVKCVVLNACYSEVQAQSISSVVQYVIGMSRAIGDIAAIKFSTGFYDALAFGRSFTEAFQYGCNAISLRGIPESLTPMLLGKGGVQFAASLIDDSNISEIQRENVHQVGRAQDPSVKELISILDFRADVILAEMEKHQRAPLDVAREATREPVRDMEKLDKPESEVEHTHAFADLHERNKKALINGEFVLSHEITRKIQHLLFNLNTSGRVPLLSIYVYSKLWLLSLLPRSFAGVYPGPLPESLKATPNPVVLMWKQDEEEEHRATKNKEEETERQQAETHLREAELRKERDRCPRCGFKYGWNGMDCRHCHYSKG